MYGIPFVLDNSATAMVSNKRRLFTGKLNTDAGTLYNAKVIPTIAQLVRSLLLVLTDNINEHNSYIVANFGFYLDTPINILGVPPLRKFYKKIQLVTAY